ncbi:hypothetical protein Pelo_5075, partial [Pelomyxa schiedti]
MKGVSTKATTTPTGLISSTTSHKTGGPPPKRPRNATLPLPLTPSSRPRAPALPPTAGRSTPPPRKPASPASPVPTPHPAPPRLNAEEGPKRPGAHVTAHHHEDEYEEAEAEEQEEEREAEGDREREAGGRGSGDDSEKGRGNQGGDGDGDGDGEGAGRGIITTAAGGVSVPGVVTAALAAHGIHDPPPLVVATFESTLSGKDLLCHALPGKISKCLSFVVPLVSRLLRNPVTGPAVICLTANTQLSQMNAEIFSECGGGAVGVWNVDSAEASPILSTCNIIVGTPLNFNKQLENNTLSVTPKMTTFILDEVDKMLQYARLVDSIFARLTQQAPRDSLQTIIMATSQPPWLENVTAKYLKQGHNVVSEKDVELSQQETKNSSGNEKAFEKLGLAPENISYLTSLGYSKPAALQELTYEHIKSGRDVFCHSYPSLGKTISFVVPVVELCARVVGMDDGQKHSKKVRGGDPIVLCICATVKACIEIAKQFKGCSSFHGSKKAGIVGVKNIDSPSEEKSK